MKKVLFIFILTVTFCIGFSASVPEVSDNASKGNVSSTNVTKQASKPEDDNKTAIDKQNTTVAALPEKLNTTANSTTGTPSTPPPPAAAAAAAAATSTNTTSKPQKQDETVPPKSDTGVGKNNATLLPTGTTEPTKSLVPVTNSTAVSNTTTTTEGSKADLAAAAQTRRFDSPSFIGGIILTLGLIAIGFMGFKYYRAQTERNYHTL